MVRPGHQSYIQLPALPPLFLGKLHKQSPAPTHFVTQGNLSLQLGSIILYRNNGRNKGLMVGEHRAVNLQRRALLKPGDGNTESRHSFSPKGVKHIVMARRRHLSLLNTLTVNSLLLLGALLKERTRHDRLSWVISLLWLFSSALLPKHTLNHSVFKKM